MIPEQVWVSHQSLEWEFSALFKSETPDSITVHTLLVNALSVFHFDSLIEPLARLTYKGEIQPQTKLLRDYKEAILEFELILAHSVEGENVYKTKYFSPLDFIKNDDEEQNSEIIYLYGDERLSVNAMLVEGMTLAASNLQYAPVIGCLGNTGTGKSLILTSILDRQVDIPLIRIPEQTGSTTANINIYQKHIERESLDNQILYLDFEGENGTAPQGLLQGKFWRNLDIVPNSEGSRRSIVKKQFPKIAYILCDIILLITTDEIGSDYSVYDRCLEFAQRANIQLLDTDRPSIIIIHNKFAVSLENVQNELDVDISSQLFLDTFDKENELAKFFSSCKVVRLPLLSQAHDSALLRSLWDQQIEKLLDIINNLSHDRYESRKEFGYQLTETAWFKILPKVVEDVSAQKRLSMATYLQDLQHVQLENQTGFVCEIFRYLLHSGKKNDVEWFYQCASIAIDALARNWGSSQYEQGLQMDSSKIKNTPALLHLLQYLDQMKPCTAILKVKNDTYQCLQTRALHDHHRCIVKRTGVTSKIKGLFGKKTKTIIWEGDIESNFDEYNRDEQLKKQFESTAIAFVHQDEKQIEKTLHKVFHSEEYKTSIWSVLLNNQYAACNSNFDPSLRQWAQELTQYCMKMMNLRAEENLWELATHNWNYLNALCKFIPFSSIKIDNDTKLGSGELASVYSGSFTSDDRNIQCAIKVVPENSPIFNLSGLRQEIVVLSVVSHPRLVKFYGYSYNEEKQKFYLLQFKMEMNLSEWVKQIAPQSCIEQGLQIIADIAESARVVHSFNIVHRDMAPGNVLLIRESGIWRASLSDFGIARKLAKGGMTRYAPQESFSAPELLSSVEWECPYTQAIDVFSFGKLSEMIVNAIPISSESTIKAQIIHLVHQCTHHDPQRRPPMAANLVFVQALM